MRNINLIALTLFAVSLSALAGCGDSSISPVSGTVTFDGKPVPNLRLVFSPEPIGDNYAVGPFSTGKTDADGRFTLETRHGDQGAFVGMHKVSFEFTDVSPDALDNLNEQMIDAKADGDKDKFQEVQQKMAKLNQKLKGRPNIGQVFKAIKIPSGGTDDLKLEFNDIVQ